VGRQGEVPDHHSFLRTPDVCSAIALRVGVPSRLFEPPIKRIDTRVKMLKYMMLRERLGNEHQLALSETKFALGHHRQGMNRYGWLI